MLNYVRIAVKKAILLKKDESVLIICDRFREDIAKLFFEACEKITPKVVLTLIKQKGETEREPPKQIAKLMKEFDVILAITSISLTHTEAVRKALRAGARVATMPGITKEMLPALAIDYKKMRKIGEKIARKFEKCKRIFIKDRNGTRIEVRKDGRKVQIQDGILDKPGSLHNLPAGEVGIAPLENFSNGIVVFDTCLAGIGKLKRFVKVLVENGKIVKISGGREAKKFEDLIEKADKNAKILCEFSIGINWKAKLIGNVLNDEKAYGTCHFAFGDNLSIGGKNRSKIHLDGVISKPVIWFNGEKIVEKRNITVL